MISLWFTESTIPLKICSIEGCEKSVLVTKYGYCSPHYQKYRKYGDPLGSKPRHPDAIVRFGKFIDFTPYCWTWVGTRTSKKAPYATFAFEGRRVRAHRWIYEYYEGSVPQGKVIDHICGNTLCVNPLHLRAITQKQNSENKRGARKGSRSGVRGVSWNTHMKVWIATVTHYGVRYYLGCFKDLEEAKQVVIAKRLELYTHNEEDKLSV